VAARDMPGLAGVMLPHHLGCRGASAAEAGADALTPYYSPTPPGTALRQLLAPPPAILLYNILASTITCGTDLVPAV
jgi:hypothetical protein